MSLPQPQPPVEPPKWLRALPVAPEYSPTLAEFADPVAYILRARGLPLRHLRGHAPLSPPPREATIRLLKASFASNAAAAGDGGASPVPAFPTLLQLVGLSTKNRHAANRRVWENGPPPLSPADICMENKSGPPLPPLSLGRTDRGKAGPDGAMPALRLGRRLPADGAVFARLAASLDFSVVSSTFSTPQRSDAHRALRRLLLPRAGAAAGVHETRQRRRVDALAPVLGTSWRRGRRREGRVTAATCGGAGAGGGCDALAREDSPEVEVDEAHVDGDEAGSERAAVRHPARDGGSGHCHLRASAIGDARAWALVWHDDGSQQLS